MSVDLTGTRHTSRRVELLTAAESPLGRMVGVQGGGINHSVASTVRSSGSLTALALAQDIDWLSVRLQPYLTVNGEDFPLGVFLPSAPSTSWSATAGVRDIQVLDKLTVLNQDLLPWTYALPAGANVIEAVTTLIEDAGEQAGALTASDEVLRGDIVWEPGTSRLRVINDVLDAAGYFSLWCDVHGQYRAEPYVTPSSRPVVWDFSGGRYSIRSASFSHSQDVYSIPNRVIVTSRSSGDEEALIAVAENVNPDSPTSIPSRGRVIAHSEDDVEATSQAALDTYAERRLTELSSAVTTVTITHAFIPQLELNSAVRFADVDAGIDGTFVVQRMETPFTATGLVTTTLREVVA